MIRTIAVKEVPQHMLNGFKDLAEISGDKKWLFEVRYILFMLDDNRDNLLYNLAKSSKQSGCEYMLLWSL